MFDFDKEWASVKPVLDDPLAIAALDAGMTVWCEENNKEWDPNAGPWAYSDWPDWHFGAAVQKCYESERGDELEHLAGLQGCPSWKADQEACQAWYNSHWNEINDRQNELIEDFYPQPATPDWYRCVGACHWLVPWNCAIGELLYPDLVWHVIVAKEHSTAIGMDNSTTICMDILWGKSGASRIWDAVREGEWSFLQDTILFGAAQPMAREAISPSTPSPPRESVPSVVSGVASQLSLAQ
ncbi:MAG: hypothetical protein GY832_00420 [Chloroflexi bacterium]|nr:hypothetical protein [Chloroflexota bacterium]